MFVIYKTDPEPAGTPLLFGPFPTERLAQAHVDYYGFMNCGVLELTPPQEPREERRRQRALWLTDAITYAAAVDDMPEFDLPEEAEPRAFVLANTDEVVLGATALEEAATAFGRALLLSPTLTTEPTDADLPV